MDAGSKTELKNVLDQVLSHSRSRSLGRIQKSEYNDRSQNLCYKKREVKTEGDAVVICDVSVREFQ